MTTAPAGSVSVFPIHKIVASEVRAWKARLRVTQEELAEVLGVSQQGISRRLNGQTPFTLDELGQVAAYFKVSPAVLLGGGPAPADGLEPSTCRLTAAAEAVEPRLRLVPAA